MGVRSWLRNKYESFTKDEVAQMGNISEIALGIITTVIIGAVGLYVADQIFTVAVITTGSIFYTASQTVASMMETGVAMILIGIVAVLAGFIILAISWRRQR